MSITSAKSGATGISLALDNNYMEPIASTLVGSGGVNQVTFNDIPQNYKHLQIRAYVQTNRVTYCRDGINIRVNGDSSASYSDHSLYGDGASAGSGSNVSQTVANGGTVGSSTVLSGLMFGARIIDILDYTNASKYKTIRTLGGLDMNGTGTGSIGGLIDLVSGLWMNQAPVTSVTILPSLGTTINQYSRFSLYGIKG